MDIGYEAKVTLNPTSGKRGETVKLEVEYANADSGDSLERSVLRVSEYGIYDVMKREGDRKFSWMYPIPWEAPLKTYTIEVYALDALGNKGPVKSVQYQVTG